MKKAHVYMILALCIVVFLAGIYFIYQNQEAEKFTSFYPTSKNEVYDLQEKDVAKMNIKKTWYENYHVMKSIVTIFPEHIFMFEVEEGKEEKIKAACHAYIQKLKKKYANGSQMGILNNYKEYMDENYYFLVISEDADKIMRSIKERM